MTDRSSTPGCLAATPRTEAIVSAHGGRKQIRESAYWLMVQHAEQLERELAVMSELYAREGHKNIVLMETSAQSENTTINADLQHLSSTERSVREQPKRGAEGSAPSVAFSAVERLLPEHRKVIEDFQRSIDDPIAPIGYISAADRDWLKAAPALGSKGGVTIKPNWSAEFNWPVYAQPPLADEATPRKVRCSCVTMQYQKCALCDENGYIVAQSATERRYTVDQLEKHQDVFESLRIYYHKGGDHDGQRACEFALEAIRLYQNAADRKIDHE